MRGVLLVLHGHEANAGVGEQIQGIHKGRTHNAERGVDAVGHHGFDERFTVGHEVGLVGRRFRGVGRVGGEGRRGPPERGEYTGLGHRRTLDKFNFRQSREHCVELIAA